MSTNDDAVDLLLAARDDIARPGKWLQGDEGDVDGDGAVCALGAIARAAQRGARIFPEQMTPTEETATRAARDIVWEKGFPSIPDFNDSPCTTQQDVVEMFDAAATRLKGQA